MYIVSSFRGGATAKSNIFFVIVFESQKPSHLNGRWGGERKEGGEGGGRWMEECGRDAAVEQLTARGMLSIPAMEGNSSTLHS